MNIEGGFLLLLAPIFVLPAIYWSTRLVNWISGRKLIPVWLPFALFAVALVLGSLYLDNAGIVTQVIVRDKRDVISYGKNGSWNRNLSLDVEYQPPEELTTTLLTLGCDAAAFDGLSVGQTVEARVLEFGGYFKFARMKDRSTLSLVTRLIPRSPRGPWRESTAVVREINHITEYSLRGRSGASVSPLSWPFNIVQLDFTPEGRTGTITAVDVVEAASVPGLKNGASVRITWPEDDPRSAKIVGARPGAPWANWFYSMAETMVIYAALVALLILIVGIIWRRWRRSLEKARKALP